MNPATAQTSRRSPAGCMSLIRRVRCITKAQQTETDAPRTVDIIGRFYPRLTTEKLFTPCRTIRGICAGINFWKSRSARTTTGPMLAATGIRARDGQFHRQPAGILGRDLFQPANVGRFHLGMVRPGPAQENHGWKKSSLHLAVILVTCQTTAALPSRDSSALSGGIFPKYWEVKKVYQPVAIAPVDLKPGKVAVKVTNRNSFLNLNEYEARWSVISSEGKEIQSGILSPMDCPPGKSCAVKIPVEKIRNSEAGVEFWLRVSFHTKTDSLWAKAGHEIAWQQMPLVAAGSREHSPHQATESQKLKLVQDGDVVRLTGTNFSAAFSRTAGTLTSLKFGGREMLLQAANVLTGPVLQLFRAPTDNDKGFGKWLARDWREAGLTNLTQRVDSFEVRQRSASAKFKSPPPRQAARRTADTS